MGQTKAPTFTEAELRRAMKIAGEQSLSVVVEKHPGRAVLRFIPVDATPEPTKGTAPNEW